MSAQTIAGEHYLVLFYTDRCNIACRHCIVRSGPDRSGRMALDEALAALDSAAASGVARVVLSGGENLLFLDDVLALCRHASTLQLPLRLYSNGWWGKSEAASRRMLERLADAGLTELVISIDRFHAEQLPPERLHPLMSILATGVAQPANWLQMVLAPGIEVPIAGEPWAEAIGQQLAAYGLDLDQVTLLGSAAEAGLAIQFLPAFIGGRALDLQLHDERLPPAEHTEDARHRRSGRPLQQLRQRCPAAGRQLTIRADGRAYPCCSSWTNHPRHSLGRVDHNVDLAALIERSASDPVVQLIHNHGPGALLRQLAADGEVVRDAYTDICNACEELFCGFTPGRLERAARTRLDRSRLEWLLSEPAPTSADPQPVLS